ncbi:site-specific integrase [Nostoc sp. UCD121]|nr:tyrosine-type recombinase/integrase [Nostoc sp. UCD121]MBC1280808.1 site-specific integrase [Nostoc sp. UCD121]
MSRPHLAIVHSFPVAIRPIPFSEQLEDHQAILYGYLDTHLTRNHSPATLESDRQFLEGWFENYPVPDNNHPEGYRPLMVWEAMEAVRGRERIIAFSKGLVAMQLKSQTIRTYLGQLRRFFGYVLEFPYIPGTAGQSIIAKYGRLEQPVSEYDYPHHVIDHENEGFVLTGQQLINFYDFIRTEYLSSNQKKITASRDYTMVVIAGESGLRADEIRHLDIHRDLFYEKNRIQTRHGKGFKGSGKRIRKTIMTPLAKDTLAIYERQIRPYLPNSEINTTLFLTERGELISYQQMWSALNKIVEQARKTGLDLPPKFAWHSLRKSFATNYMEKRPGDIWVLMDLMGHINPSTLQRYVKPSKQRYEEAIDNMINELTLHSI